MIIFDLDGTIALDHHRSHFLKGDVKYWDEYFNACVHDEPNKPIIDLLKRSAKFEPVAILTGRSEKVKQQTIDWLVQQEVWHLLEFMQMRAIDDRTADDELKLFWAKRYEEQFEPITLIFEDRQRVVNMWRANGYTCCQVAPGAF